MRLYASEQLSDIRARLLAGERKFHVGAYKFVFAASAGGYLIQRIPNFALGLAYSPGEDSWAVNYPHLSNVRASDLGSISRGWVQEKHNGTNLGYVRVGRRIIHRTRGTLEPDIIINDINAAIIQGKRTIIGVNEDRFSEFKSLYQPILKEGIASGYVDEFGNVNIGRIAKETLPAVSAPFDSIPSLMGVFGEMCSKFNPICVDEAVSVGIYLGMDAPYGVVAFDAVSRTDDGAMVFWGPDTLDQLGIRSSGMAVAKSIELSARLLQSDLLRTKEEGFVVKSPSGYFKLKREDVLRWERTVGYLPNILEYSVAHVFAQEFSFTRDEVMAGALKKDSLGTEIMAAAWEEAGSNGVTRDQILEFYSTIYPGRTGPQLGGLVDGRLKELVTEKLLLFAAPALKEAGVRREELWREIPKYLRFDREPIYFDQRKGKERGHDWYSKLIGGVIGRTYY